MAFLRPTDLAELPGLLAGGGWRVLAGGTDLYPAAGARLAGDVLDLSGLAAMRGITPGPDGLRFGAMTTWAQVAAAQLPPACRALQQAALQVGGRQVQNAGTLGGNLCNASPAADGVPPLLALDAQAELFGPTGTRQLPLADFLLGPRKTALSQGEVLVALHLPSAALAGRSAFEKLGARAYLVISIAMVAARVVVAGGRIAQVAVAAGACSPVARRMSRLEAALKDQPVSAAQSLISHDLIAPDLSPIDDVRATADYRLQAATELVRRALAGALE